MSYNIRDMVYLDYAATVPMPTTVRIAMHKAEKAFFANASALHTPGYQAKTEIESCRELIAKMIGASPGEIIFTAGATEANNTVIRTFEGYRIRTSSVEHHSVLEPAKIYRGKKHPTLYSYMLANNETGELLDLAKIRKIAQNESADKNSEIFKQKDAWGHDLVTLRKGGYLHSDLSQALGKIDLDVNDLGLDYATFSAHKIGGPIGVGALYVRSGVPFKPLLVGGNQENGRRSGTYNSIGIVGFGAALTEVLNLNSIYLYDTKVRKLRDDLARRILAEIPGSTLNTDIRRGRSLPNILNTSFKAAEGESIQLYLDAEGIIVSTGSACAAGDTKPSHVLMAKTNDAEIAHSSIRFSFGLDNTIDDVEEVMRVLPGIVRRLQGISTIV